MSDYRMDIRGVIGLSEYSNIYDYLCVVDKEDKFTISIDKEDEDSIHTINSMLKDNKFIVDGNGYDKNGKYYINAHRYG
ncbi:MAG: hypothetical protein ACRCVJ_17205 [Clostridium sp.]|uniref:hypothetical protein n=1 Tax=Clostridium sp. TaxID=1506 RepID=UPI003F3BA3B7